MMLKLVAGTLFTLVALACLVLSVAPFTPAVFLSFLILASCGILAVMGYLQLALWNMLISIIAIILSPMMPIVLTSTSIGGLLLYLSPFLLGFGGVAWRVRG